MALSVLMVPASTEMYTVALHEALPIYVTFVGIIDSDQGLFGTDFRSSERLAQSILQVSGRAGRGKRPGEVWIQTWYPDHPLLKILLEQGYDAFATVGLAERRAAAWPPFSHIALLRAEYVKRDPLFRFLDYARDCGAIDEHSPLRARQTVL